MTTELFDLIGDTHGCHKTLSSLLEIMGYRKASGTYRHPRRKVIFMGDFIDRGPGQRGVINIVRPMIEAGHAYTVMGNHEFNAIAYHSTDPDSGEPLRAHSDKNKNQHKEFLAAYEGNASEHADVIEWFKGLPLWLELPGLRAVHACWDKQWIRKLGDPYLTDEVLLKATQKGTWQYTAIETLLKGKEVPLLPGHSFKDKDGNERREIRVRWWDKDATDYQSAFMGPESGRTHLPDEEIEGDHLVEYGHNEPPVFLGHYWFEGNPIPLASNIVCLDYSVAKPGGKLSGYRWDGEQILNPSKFIWVERRE